MTDAYIAGFCKAAEAYGLDPSGLAEYGGMSKQAFWPAVLGLAALGYGVYRGGKYLRDQMNNVRRQHKNMLNNAPQINSYEDIQKVEKLKNGTAVSSLGQST